MLQRNRKPIDYGSVIVFVKPCDAYAIHIGVYRKVLLPKACWRLAISKHCGSDQGDHNRLLML